MRHHGTYCFRARLITALLADISLVWLPQDPAFAASDSAQDLTSIGNGWSGDAQLFVRAQKVGGFVELAIPAKEPGASKVVLYATRAR
jgi:hypothetical protein